MRGLLCLLALLACAVQAGEPLRVVSLAPSMSEIMLELQADDLLVGVVDGGERPAALRHLPSVGRQGQLDMERLLSLKPNLLLVWPGVWHRPSVISSSAWASRPTAPNPMTLSNCSSR